MNFEHKAPLFALAFAAFIPACYIVTEKPADSAPPAAAAPTAASAASVAPTTTVAIAPTTTATTKP